MWQDYLKKDELKELEAARKKKQEVVEEYNAIQQKLKARADSRIRQAKRVAGRDK